MTDRGVAIVTGGASGIGLAIAKALLGDGWKLVIADLAPGPLEAARAQLDLMRAEATKCVVMDVANEASVIAGLDGCEAGFGPVRGLVNSAGIGCDIPFFDTSVEQFRKVLDINLTGTFTVAREAGKLMRAHGGGAIVNIASISGQRGNLGRSAYGASKGGVITLTQVMACELAPQNIRVNAIAPGPVETPLVQALQTDRMRAEWINEVPQRRYARRTRFRAALFLLDDSKRSPGTFSTSMVRGRCLPSGVAEAIGAAHFAAISQDLSTSICNSYGYKYSIIYLMRIEDIRMKARASTLPGLPIRRPERIG